MEENYEVTDEDIFIFSQKILDKIIERKKFRQKQVLFINFNLINR